MHSAPAAIGQRVHGFGTAIAHLFGLHRRSGKADKTAIRTAASVRLAHAIDGEGSLDTEGDDLSDAREMSGNAGGRIRAARNRERARLKAIVRGAAAEGKLAAALHLALETNMSLRRAAAVLAHIETPARPPTLAERMAAQADPRIPDSLPPKPRSAAMAASWGAALAAVGASPEGAGAPRGSRPAAPGAAPGALP